MSFVVGNEIVEFWTYLNASRNPLTGMLTPGDVTFTLTRQSGSTGVAAGETITWLEIGTSGTYSVAFTPDNLGRYVLELEELNASSFKRWFRFPDIEVVSAGSVFSPSFANAFCAQSDVERWTQLAFSTTSVPSISNVTAFAEARASEIIGIVAGVGFAVTPATVVAGSVEEDMLREINAIGAALDSIVVKFMQETPNRTEKAALLLEEYNARIERLTAYAKEVLSAGGFRTHVSAGELTLKDEGTTADSGLNEGIRMSEEF